MKPRFFKTASAFRGWLGRNHGSASELIVGFFKKSAGKPGMGYKEAVDEALCFGWIDGIIRRIDDECYCHRFTPRKPGSTWSKVNVARVAALAADGRMAAPGIAAFDRRSTKRTGIYGYEQVSPASIPPDCRKLLKADPRAWDFFSSRPPWYRRKVAHWLASAKRDDTRIRRAARLVAASARSQLI